MQELLEIYKIEIKNYNIRQFLYISLVIVSIYNYMYSTHNSRDKTVRVTVLFFQVSKGMANFEIILKLCLSTHKTNLGLITCYL